MSVDQLLTLVTQLTLVLISVKTLFEYIRKKDRTHLDIFLMFGDLALIVFIRWVTDVIDSPPDWISWVTSILLIAHPYLFLRLVHHLRPIPPGFHLFALVGLIISALFVLTYSGSLPLPFTLLIVAYFVIVEGFGAIMLIQGARRTRGVSYRRLLLAALGSLLLAALILVAGANAAFPTAERFLQPLSRLAGLLSILSFYLAFATPNALRRSWQLAELYRYLSVALGGRADERAIATIQRLCSAAELAVGGSSAVVASWDKESRIEIQASSEPEDLTIRNSLSHPSVSGVWPVREPRLWRIPEDLGLVGVDQAAPGKIRALYSVPIESETLSWGVLLVFLANEPLFESDDLALLSLLCEQTAIALSYVDLVAEQRAMIEQLRRSSQRLETYHEIDRAILAARLPEEIAKAALSNLRDLVPTVWASVHLIDPENQRVYVVAVEDPEGIDPPPGASLPLEDFPPIELLSQNDPVLYIDDTTSFEHCAPIIERLHSKGVRSLILAPLLNGENLIGELGLASCSVAAFEVEHQEIAREVADQLAITIQQARLREQLQAYATELEHRVAQRTAQLESANQELEAFAYSVSHDLRAPLRAIDGFSRILATKHASEVSGEAKRFLDLIQENVRQMGQLIDDLLSFSRLSRQPLNKQRVEPAGIARLAFKEVANEYPGRNIALNIHELPACEADPSLLKQIFVNLLSNSMKFTSQRENPRIEIGCLSNNGELVYFVKDNGVGFDMRYAHKLFGVFQRLHRLDEYEGTGVGLAIVQRIIHRHGGRIWTEAELNRGATFYFTLNSPAQ